MKKKLRDINGKTIYDYKDSFVLKCKISEIIQNFNQLNDDEKKFFLNDFDKLMSELFLMPTANFIYENNEHTSDVENIYFGSLKELNGGIDLIARYLFEITNKTSYL